MRYGPSPTFKMSLFLLAVIACGGYLIWVVPDTLVRHALNMAGMKAIAPSPRHRGIGPDISHCHSENVDLWNCIRHAEDTHVTR